MDLKESFKNKYVPICFTSQEVEYWYEYILTSYKAYYNREYSGSGNLVDQAILCLFASLLTIYKSNDTLYNTGNVPKVTSSESAGDLSASYMAPKIPMNLSEQMIMSNSHGIEFYNYVQQMAQYYVV